MSFRALFKGTLTACFISAAILVICAALVYFGVLDEKIASMGAFLGAAAGGFAGALLAAKTAGSKVLVNALSVSLVCCAAAAAASFYLSGGIAFGTRLLSLIGSLIGAGVLGGVFGR